MERMPKEVLQRMPSEFLTCRIFGQKIISSARGPRFISCWQGFFLPPFSKRSESRGGYTSAIVMQVAKKFS